MRSSGSIIAWRLAVATLSFDDVLEGPTTAATLQRRGIIIKTSDTSVDLCDDGLSQLELDIICGLYHCLTGIYFFCFSQPSSNKIIFIGQGKGYASCSWWPTDSNWQKNAQHMRWTEKSDGFFATRSTALKAGTAKPLNFEQWRQQIRGSSGIWHVNDFISSASEDFIKANVRT